MLRLYRSLLHLYPAAWRAQFGDEMACVFMQVHHEIAGSRRLARAGFFRREICGLITGALRAQIFCLFGFDWVPFRRFSMRPGFRFPRSTVFLMCVILAGVVLAIERAKDIQIKYGGAESMAVWDPLPWSLLLALALALAAVAAGWGILFALRRTGMHRLASVQTGPESR